MWCLLDQMNFVGKYRIFDLWPRKKATGYFQFFQFRGNFNQQFPGQKHLLLGQFNGIWILWWKSTEFDCDSTFTFAFRRNNRCDRLDTLEKFNLILSDKSWKTHPEICPKSRFSRRITDRFLENSSISACVMKNPKILNLTIGWVFQKSVCATSGKIEI